MLRIATALAAMAAVVPAAPVAAHRADTPPARDVVARVVGCDMTSGNRSASFYARMDAIPATAKMQVRFQLLERLGRGDSWDKVDVPALRAWHTSQAGVKRFGWKQTVDALRLGGSYKSRIQYRWVSAAGAIIATETRDTPVCRGPLPNFSVGSLTVRPGPTPDTRIYRVDVSNNGKIDATQVSVSLTVDKAILDMATVVDLAAGGTRTVSFTGPGCRHFVRAKADPVNAIGESFETDNSRLFTCP